jgi:hypothetical protein
MIVRDHLIQALRAELVGPYDLGAATAQEVLHLSPSRRYLTGFLAPPEVDADHTPPRQDDDEIDPFAADELDGDDGFAVGSDKESDDSSTPDPEPATRKVFPASAGISVLLPAEAKQVLARLRWGEYRRDVVVGESGELVRLPDDPRERAKAKIKGVRAWRRVQVGWLEVPVALDAKRIAHGIPIASGVYLQGRVADAGRGDGTLALALFVVNRRQADGNASRDEALLFQLEYQLCCEVGFLARPDLTGEGGSDLDDQINDLQYRNAFEYAVGHGVAAQPVAGSLRADLGGPEAPRVDAVEIAWIPRAEFKPVAAREDAPVTISMQKLGLLDTAEQVEAALGGLPAAYEACASKRWHKSRSVASFLIADCRFRASASSAGLVRISARRSRPKRVRATLTRWNSEARPNMSRSPA